VRARVETLDGLSAHADRGQLLDWVRSAKRPPKNIHLIHGEPPATEALSELLREKIGVDAHRPEYREKVKL
jgi:metallo-beta-lactamase family protein